MGSGYNVMSEKECLYIAGPRDGKEMVNRSVVAGCSNTPSDRVSLLKLPSDGVLRRIWEKQEQRTLAQWKVTKHSPFFVVTILLRTCFEGGGWAAMTIWDAGKGGCIPSTYCEVAAGG